MLVITNINYSQTFSFNTDGTADYVVFKADSLSAKDLYNKALGWINTTYKNPNAVIKAKIENQMIRLEGFERGAFSRTFKDGDKAEYDVNYTLTIEFQDGKYRVLFTHDKITVDGGQVYFKFEDVINNVPDRNGNGWPNAKAEYEKTVNHLLTSLSGYITKPKDNW